MKGLDTVNKVNGKSDDEVGDLKYQSALLYLIGRLVIGAIRD